MVKARWILALLAMAAWSCETGDEIDMGHRSGEVLFEDPLDGMPREGWRVPPDRFVDHPEFGTVYLLEPGEGSTAENQPWVGDETWENYRVEFEVCTTGEKDGWVGPDLHVSDDGADCCNLQFYSTRERDEVVFEAAGRWGRGSLGWKLFPMAQRFARLPKGEWARIRVDVGATFMNVTVNDDPESCYTVRYLPFSKGGVRFWNYYGSAYIRNLRVTVLDENEVQPALEDPWETVAGQPAVGGWQMSRLLPEGTGKDGTPRAIVPEDAGWRDVEADHRGVVVVSALGPEYATKKGVVFARATIESPAVATRDCRLTYTDQLTMWVNGREVFRGEPRGWFDPGRSLEDWFGRLMPDQFESSLPLEPGENEILIRLEVNEPLFGSGFWLRTE
jgi:hypothetical protein